MGRKPLPLALALYLVACLVGVGFVADVAHAQAPVSFAFSPANATIDCGETLTVDVVIPAAINDLRGFGGPFIISYDPAVFNPTSVVPGTLIDGAACNDFFVWHNSASPNGTIEVDLALLGCSVAGPGTILTIEFEGVLKGTSSIDHVSGVMRDSANQPIAFTLASDSMFDVCNLPPVADDANFSIAENSANGTFVGQVIASDPDPGDGLSYAITGGNIGTAFAIDGSGNITVNDQNQLDHETLAAYTLTVTVSDTGTPILNDTAVVDITVDDVNEAPVVTNPGVQSDAEVDVISLPIAASDVDVGQTLTYSALNLPGGLSIDPVSGLISGTIDCGAAGVYSVDVTATDNGVPVLDDTVNFSWTVDPSPVPAAIGDLASSQVVTGNDIDGTTQITLTWSGVSGSHTVQVFRKGFGSYPEYDDAGGSVPTAPTDPADAAANSWAAATPVLSGQTDEPGSRDFWYYVAFVLNECGVVSAVSNVTGGSLNYHLGDFAGGGNNTVTTVDLSAFGAGYGVGDGDGNWNNILDVGPTTNFSTTARPTTDDFVGFEDLILFAINFNLVDKALQGPEPSHRNVLTLYGPGAVDQGDVVDVLLWLEGDGRIQGMSVPLAWNPLVVEPLDQVAGGLLAAQGGTAITLAPSPGTVDVALFGVRSRGISGEGHLASVSFRVLSSGDPAFAVGDLVARDAANQVVPVSTTSKQGLPDALQIPEHSLLHGNYPNPFNPSTTIRFGVAQTGPVTLTLYSLSGRFVATLVNEVVVEGTHAVEWNGRDSGGRSVASGVYIARLIATDRSQVRRLTLLK